MKSRWSFRQTAYRTVFFQYVGDMCVGSYTRLNYSAGDAQTFIDYLNSRHAP